MLTISSILPLRCAVIACLVLAANIANPPVAAQNMAYASVEKIASAVPFSYADYGDLVDRSPLVVMGEISQVIPLKPAQSQGVQPGFRRAFITIKITKLIRGEGGVAPNLSYLYDIRLDARGKLPKFKKRPVILFARPGTRQGEVQLIAPDAQVDWSANGESTVRSIVGELLGARTPPRITGLGDAFYVAGTVQGEGETQIFLKTDSGDPVSLSIVRRPGQEPRWAVALGEIVDEAAAAPQPDTLLWYRLACSLPPALPAASVRTLAASDAESARQDYQVVLAGLGACGRTRAVR